MLIRAMPVNCRGNQRTGIRSVPLARRVQWCGEGVQPAQDSNAGNKLLV